MPGSAMSVSGASSSSGSRRGKTRQYRTVSHHSQVDECLFGQAQSEVMRKNMINEKFKEDPADFPSLEKLAKERNSRRKNGNGKPQKELVTVITKDLIRNLIVPSEDPSGESIIVPRDQFYRIMQSSRVFTKEDKESERERMKREKENNMDAAQERKNQMKQLDMTRNKNAKLNDLEEEAKEKAEHLLSRANEMRQEQEDEIKHLNEVILNAKCHAIRDAQILEKEQVKKEMIDEERRLDVMMEVDRQNALKINDEIDRKKKEEQLLGAAKLMEQIDENEQERLFELERKDQENIQMQSENNVNTLEQDGNATNIAEIMENMTKGLVRSSDTRYIEKLMEEDQESLDKKKVEQLGLREELNKANDAILHRKEYKALQEKAEELKVLEFQKQKAEREAVFEKEQMRLRIEKEREVAKLRSMQERAKDEQAERDAMRAKRSQEQAEREWRRKEAEEARKKAELEDSLKCARTMQMQQKEHFQAVQAQRERAEFERVLRAQKELVEKQKREENSMQNKRHVHADDVRAQIREKERARISDRNAFFEEGIKLDEEARERRMKLEAVKKKKLGELRNAGIPEKYLAQVERKVNEPHNIMV